MAHPNPPNQDEIARYQERLRRLAAELALSEERQRREIAEDLHDHLGQALAMLRLKLLDLKGNAVFCGLDHPIEEMDRLLGQAIRYTRSLTFEISPPILYELGLGPALEWLAEEFGKRHALTIRCELAQLPDTIRSPLRVMLFKSVRELLMNVVKHAQAREVVIRTTIREGMLEIGLQDDGKGFSAEGTAIVHDAGGFGLFSIRERLALLDGELRIRSGASGSEVLMRLPVAACGEIG